MKALITGKKEGEKEGGKEGGKEKKSEKGKELLRFLGEKEKPKEIMSWKEIKENEVFIFELLKWGHLLVFLALFL